MTGVSSTEITNLRTYPVRAVLMTNRAEAASPPVSRCSRTKKTNVTTKLSKSWLTIVLPVARNQTSFPPVSRLNTPNRKMSRSEPTRKATMDAMYMSEAAPKMFSKASCVAVPGIPERIGMRRATKMSTNASNPMANAI